MLLSAYHYRCALSASSTANTDVSLLAEDTGEKVFLSTAVQAKPVFQPIVSDLQPMTGKHEIRQKQKHSV